jgi:two-component system, OmpR family, sensor histidine kinase CiaH
LGVTTLVIVVVFAAIYIFSTQSANGRPPVLNQDASYYANDFNNILEISLKQEKQAAAQNLLITLIVSGVAIEILVAIISYYLAEEAIKPIRETYESQKVFIANASHEIKTPLAAISANLEAADIHNNKWISNVEEETEKLTKLNRELLNLTRADLREKSEKTEVDVNELVKKLLNGFEPRMEKVQLTKSISTNGKIMLAKSDFEQIFGILMDNAIKYSDQKITLKLKNHELKIANDGTKIDAKNLPHIFERFYQADKNTEGVGLGLSIAKTLAEQNGWELTANPTKTMTEFCLKF